MSLPRKALLPYLSLMLCLGCTEAVVSVPSQPQDEDAQPWELGDMSEDLQSDAPDEPDEDMAWGDDMANTLDLGALPFDEDMSELADMAQDLGAEPVMEPQPPDPPKDPKDPDPPKPKPKRLRVMTYNIKRGSITSIEQIANVIRQQGADVVGLQEVFEGIGGNPASNAKRLGQLLGMHSVFRQAQDPKGGGVIGNAVLSKYPILSVKRIELTSSEQYKRMLMIARLKLPDGTVMTIGNTHFGLTSWERQLQAREVRQAMRGRTLAVLTGDFNSVPSSPVQQQLRQDLRDTWNEAGSGPGPTVPARTPRNRIDYIFRTRDWVRAEHAVVPNTQASDHRPVRVDVLWRPKS